MAAIAVKQRHFVGGGSKLDGNADYETTGLAAILRNIADDLAMLNLVAIAAANYAAPSANPAVTSVQEATADANAQGVGYVQADAQTMTALANSLQTKYNALQVDIAALNVETASLHTQLVALAADVAGIRSKINTAASGSLLTTKSATE